MMTLIRVLTDKGREQFTDYILQARRGVCEQPPREHLSRAPWSSEFSPPIEIGPLTATTRMELGKYLLDIFEANGVERKDILNNPGMWSWLALFWFDNLCYIEDDGKWTVHETARYVCSSDYTDYFRHLVAASWDIFYLHREKSRLLLWTPLYTHSDFIEQLASRQKIITNKALIEAFDRLYWDPKKNRPKSGAQNRKKAGNFRRLLSVVKQLELTYDLRAMSADEILTLLPAEFDIWKRSL